MMKCEVCAIELTAFYGSTFPGGAKIHSCRTCFMALQVLRELVV